MKKIIILGLLFVTLMTLLAGCVPLMQQAYEPKENPEEIWVCEKPFIWFSWNGEEDLFDGKMTVFGEVKHIYVFFGYACDMGVLSHEKLPVEDPSRTYQYIELFEGHVEFRNGMFECKVKEDYENVFRGTFPKLKFKRYNKEEYIREHGELE